MVMNPIEKFWRDFCKAKQLPNSTPYTAWAFGATSEDADELAELVRLGKKTATTSLFASYAADQEAGECSVILDGHNQPICVIQNLQVTVKKYNEITEEDAAMEGEGDLSLQYWQQVHEPFLTNALKSLGETFSPDILIVFEKFVCIYAPAII